MQPPRPFAVHLFGMNKFKCPLSSSSMSQQINSSLSGSDPNQSLGELDYSLIQIKTVPGRRASESLTESKNVTLDVEVKNEDQAEALLKRSHEIILSACNSKQELIDHEMQDMPHYRFVMEEDEEEKFEEEKQNRDEAEVEVQDLQDGESSEAEGAKS